MKSKVPTYFSLSKLILIMFEKIEKIYIFDLKL